MTKYIIEYRWKRPTSGGKEYGTYEHAVKAKTLLAALAKSEKLFCEKFPDRQIMCLEKPTRIEDDDGHQW